MMQKQTVEDFKVKSFFVTQKILNFLIIALNLIKEAARTTSNLMQIALRFSLSHRNRLSLINTFKILKKMVWIQTEQFMRAILRPLTSFLVPILIPKGIPIVIYQFQLKLTRPISDVPKTPVTAI